MLLRGQRLFTVFVVVCALPALAIRVDTGKTQATSSSTGDFSRGKEKFNPGQTQNGGWHKPESAVLYGDNAWKEADLSVFGSSKDEVSRLSEGHGVNFNDGTSVKVGQIASFSSDSGQQFNGFSGGSLNGGGDLVVGQGSVQRPANLGLQYQSHSAFAQGESSSFPVHAKIGADTSQYSQVVSTHSKAPVSGLPDYNNRQQIGNIDNRHPQVKPIQSQYHGTKPVLNSPQTFGHKISQTHATNQYPAKPSPARPPTAYHQKVSSKPVQPQYKPDVHYPTGSSRHPPQKAPQYPLRGGAKPVVSNKYPGQPSYQYPKSHLHQQAQISRGGISSGTF